MHVSTHGKALVESERLIRAICSATMDALKELHTGLALPHAVIQS